MISISARQIKVINGKLVPGVRMRLSLETEFSQGNRDMQTSFILILENPLGEEFRIEVGSRVNDYVIQNLKNKNLLLTSKEIKSIIEALKNSNTIYHVHYILGSIIDRAHIEDVSVMFDLKNKKFSLKLPKTKFSGNLIWEPETERHYFKS